MNKPIRIIGLLLAGFSPLAHGDVLISDFSSFSLDYTYAQWAGGTFTSDPTNFRVEANDFGGGGKGVSVNGTGCDTLQVTLDVNDTNASDKFNIVLTDADGTQRVYRFEGLATGVEELGVVLTKELTNFLQDNAPGSIPGLDLANIVGFDLQGSFSNGDPGLFMDLTFDTLEVTSVGGPGPITDIPNKDFEIPAGFDWSSASVGGGTFVFNFPTGYAEIDHSANNGGFGLLKANNATNLPIAGLGLAAGKTYTFSVDMRIESGSNIGGLKVDFQSGGLDGGSTGYLFPPSGSGTWTTYDFSVTLPPLCTAIQICLVSGDGSVVQYDNVDFTTPEIANPTLTQIPNGDFEILGGGGWAENSGFGTFDFVYPATGGNTGGYGVMDNTADGTGFGVLVGNNDAIIPLAGLGLSPGNTYTFSQDMTIFAGSNLGGVKIEFYDNGAPQGSTGDIFPALIGDGSTWETYEFDVEIPPCANGFKLVLLWGAASEVGFDNITVSTTPVVLPPGNPVIPNGDFEAGGTDWAYYTDGYDLAYLPTGGVDDSGYAEIDAFFYTGFFGVLVSNNNAPLKLSALGLEPGKTYNASMDMKIIDGEGSSLGGLKVEYWVAGLKVSETENMYPTLIGDGSTWETYEFEFTIPECANEIKFVAISGPDSRVGYDNIVIDPNPVDTTIPKIVSVSKSGNAFTVVFESKVGFTYNLLHSPDLVTGFTQIDSGLVGTGGNLSFTDNAATGTQGYYRVGKVASP